MGFTYNLYGLTIVVPFPCPILAPAAVGAEPDVTVTENPVIHRMPHPVAEGHNWQAVPGCFLFSGGRYSGRFMVEAGERITLERNKDAKDERLCAHLLAAVFAALLRQRGLLVLHANVVTTPRGAIAITGVSGAGKSTTQAALMAHGARMVSDDITVIDLDPEGSIVALPGILKMNLCDDAATKFGHDVAVLPRNPLRSSKVLVPVAPDETLLETVPLKAIYHLDSHPGERVIATHLAGAKKFAVLQECIYGPLFPEEHHGLFPLITSVVSQIDIVRIVRPVGRWSANEVMETILYG
jgi:hypothetical protein